MAMRARNFTAFTSGVVSIYKEKDRKTDFSAKRNPKTLDDLEFIVKLSYDEASKRQQDLEFAEQAGFQLSLKIRTRYVPEVRSKMKAVINGYLYDISYLDKAGREMFLYLESVREVESDAAGNQ